MPMAISMSKFPKCFPLNFGLIASFGTANLCKLRVRKLYFPNEASEEIQKYELTHFLKGIWFDLADIQLINRIRGLIDLSQESPMLLAVVIAKSLIELSLMFIVGRFLLGLLAGPNRDNNVFWQLLDVASKPTLWLTRKISPRLILDRHIPLATSSWLIIAWVLVVQMKIEMCLELGIATCQ